MNLENKILQVCFDILEKEKTPLEAQKEIFRLFNDVGQSEQLNAFMDYCCKINETWAEEFRAWIEDYEKGI